MNWNGKSVLVTGRWRIHRQPSCRKAHRVGSERQGDGSLQLGAAAPAGSTPRQFRDQMEIVAGDITDSGSVYHSMCGCDTVFHLAALIAIPYSYTAPASYVQTNVVGTLNVLEASRRLGTERIVHTSTSEVYGTALTVPISEEHPLQGQSPYSASKIGADKLAESYHRSFDTPVVTVRPFNTFGPRQSCRAVLPDDHYAVSSARCRHDSTGQPDPNPGFKLCREYRSRIHDGRRPCGYQRSDAQHRVRSRNQHRRPGHDNRPTGWTRDRH